eukprot:gene14450-10327_t
MKLLFATVLTALAILANGFISPYRSRSMLRPQSLSPRMAPSINAPEAPSQPNVPPKREVSPVAVPTVGFGNNQVPVPASSLPNVAGRLTVALSVQYDVFSRLLQDRILLLGSEVNDDVANVMVSQMLYLAAEDPT